MLIVSLMPGRPLIFQGLKVRCSSPPPGLTEKRKTVSSSRATGAIHIAAAQQQRADVAGIVGRRGLDFDGQDAVGGRSWTAEPPVFFFFIKNEVR